MRRAIVVAAATVVGLVALLDYKSSGAIGSSQVTVGGGVPVSAGPTTTTPSTPATAPGSTAPGSTAPGSTAPGSTAPGSTAAPATTPTTTVPTTTVPKGPASYTGADVTYVYGTIDVRITIADDRITAVSTPQQSADDPHSAQINTQAVPILIKETLAAQGLHFDVVSGATFTSDAFAKSLASALNQAGR